MPKDISISRIPRKQNELWDITSRKRTFERLVEVVWLESPDARSNHSFPICSLLDTEIRPHCKFLIESIIKLYFTLKFIVTVS